MEGKVSAADIEKAIKGIDFPAKRDDLVKQAEKNNSDEDVIKHIKNFPESEYNSAVDVAKAFGEEK